MLSRLTRTRDDWALSIARITLAVVTFAHGAEKVLGWFGGGGLATATKFYVETMGLPLPLVVAIFSIELLAPIALVIGLQSRAAAALIGIVTLGAVQAHAAFGFFMNWSGRQGGEGVEFHVLLLGLALAVIIGGSGAWSIDRRLNEAT